MTFSIETDVRIGDEVELLRNGKVLVIFDIIVQISVKDGIPLIKYRLGFKNSESAMGLFFTRADFLFQGK